MAVTIESLKRRNEEIIAMNNEIDKKLEQFTQQKLLNMGAIAMNNELIEALQKETPEEG